ncbi:RNA polymerase sigma factor [Microbulbifer elongatus]|uniref:RNA polymerase sigma factor n=1 Tax=Microbulbifer elongatus TaxID=86173 RepID=UPI001E51F4B2|nr:sigma-70 family RNA polymerase sigma factor [Microbulbifer elongatus]
MERGSALLGGTASAAQDETFSDLLAEKPSLLAFIRRRTRNVCEAEDIYQEAMIRVTRKLQNGAVPENPLGYLYRVTANLINDIQRQKTQPTEALDDVADSLYCQQPQPDQQLHDQQHLALFVKQLNELPMALRTMIVMNKVHGVTIKQIAQQFGLTTKAAEKQINRAIKNIEARMHQQF